MGTGAGPAVSDQQDDQQDDQTQASFRRLDIELGAAAVVGLLFAVAMGVIAFAMTVTYRNPWTLVGAVGVGALVVTVKLFARTSRLRRLATVATEQIALIAVIGVLCLAVIDDVPWMDHEEITTTSDHGIIDGYVLETAPGFVHILTAHDRQVIILPADQVTGRTIVG
ncbi:hypothetical protein GOHSU_45_00330 [Gordonia hirsuta DSM 44140 = NBRC 16056]|uniref:Uncharacterized protein n=1 Tax=Gordonia hirsuta DSM 44140 = NBRC 16056 TaxID=1121927 RepID=L7LF11_9ACTN|nr:hypothetical protein [Gordonia hirsuta]GAC58667.1 hypothetical protein GOHSU_45_00330 [Gordonia hirsuta DSM 44140 = NBRC 16056]